MIVNLTKLVRLREQAGYSIRKLAQQAGISHSHLSYIETGQREPSESVTKKLADALLVSIDDLK